MRIYLILMFAVNLSFESSEQTITKKIIFGTNDLWNLHYHDHVEFYGLFQNKKLDKAQYEYTIKKINIKDYVPQSASINDYATINNEKIKIEALEYVLAGFDSLPEKIMGWKPELNYSTLYPDQAKTFGPYTIYAKGELVEGGIKNYQIGIKANLQGKETNQIIEFIEFMETTGYANTDTIHHAGFRVDWVGDLNSDGYPEVLLVSSVYSECYSINLYTLNKDLKFQRISRSVICS